MFRARESANVVATETNEPLEAIDMLPYLTVQALVADRHQTLMTEAANDRLANQARRHRRGQRVASGRTSLRGWVRRLATVPATGGSLA